MVDHQLAAAYAVEQLCLRPAGGEAGRETGTDLGTARGQQGVRVLELLCVIGIDGQQGIHIVGIIGVQLGLDHRDGRNACIVGKRHACTCCDVGGKLQSVTLSLLSRRGLLR